MALTATVHRLKPRQEDAPEIKRIAPDFIAENLRTLYQSAESEPLPDHLKLLLANMAADDAVADDGAAGAVTPDGAAGAVTPDGAAGAATPDDRSGDVRR